VIDLALRGMIVYNSVTTASADFVFYTQGRLTQPYSLRANLARSESALAVVSRIGDPERANFVSRGSIMSLWVRFGKRLVEKHGNRCAYCGRELQQSTTGKGTLVATVDHIVPQSRGGKTTIDNLIPCCKACNSAKRDRDILHLDCGG
jgi:hypothetical protein